VSWVESAGDYVRLQLRSGDHYLVRLPISLLEAQWANHGFARIHRSYLVALRDIRELRTSEGHTVVGVGDFDLPVSRRHSKELRDRLVRHARRGAR
jgi:two-component system response regulator LytT